MRKETTVAYLRHFIHLFLPFCISF